MEFTLSPGTPFPLWTSLTIRTFFLLILNQGIASMVTQTCWHWSYSLVSSLCKIFFSSVEDGCHILLPSCVLFSLNLEFSNFSIHFLSNQVLMCLSVAVTHPLSCCGLCRFGCAQRYSIINHPLRQTFSCLVLDTLIPFNCSKISQLLISMEPVVS